MTAETKSIIEKWIEDNRMGAPVNGAVYDPGNEELTCVGIDGAVDLSELATLIESAERERCAKIADKMPDCTDDNCTETECIVRTEIAREIRKDRGCNPPQAEME